MYREEPYSVVELLQPWNGEESVHTDAILQQQLHKVYPVINERIHHGLFQWTLLQYKLIPVIESLKILDFHK